MDSIPISSLGPLILSLVLATGVIAVVALIVRGIYAAIRGLITQSMDD